jgi:hypothetical protein
MCSFAYESAVMGVAWHSSQEVCHVTLRFVTAESALYRINNKNKRMINSSMSIGSTRFGNFFQPITSRGISVVLLILYIANHRGYSGA